MLATRDGAWRPTPIATLPSRRGPGRRRRGERRPRRGPPDVDPPGRPLGQPLARARSSPTRRSAPCSASRASRSTPRAGPRRRTRSRKRTTRHLSISSGSRTNGRLTSTRITTKGFPTSVVPPAAAPVLWPDGTIRVVESFSQRGANAILWRREGKRWWGRVLHASALGAPPSPSTRRRRPTGSTSPGRSRTHVRREPPRPLESRIDRSTLDRPASERVRGRARARPVGAGGRCERAVETPSSGFLTGAVQAELDGRSSATRPRRPAAARSCSRDPTGSSGSSCRPRRPCA